jgi:type IV secretory pathway TraG/TraD family ATPase VirD4
VTGSANDGVSFCAPDLSHEGISATEALKAIRSASWGAGNGLYLGMGRIGPVWARPEQSVLVLGPPRSGKTTGLVVPSVLAAPGAVVSTSTKPDVLISTASARRGNGPCLVYDPTGTVQIPAGVERAQWSPVTKCNRWDDAQLVAWRLVSSMRPPGHGARTDGSDHWTERAQTLLAPLLHAAALEGVEMAGVLRWVDRREASRAMAILEGAGLEAPADQLAGIAVTEAREQSGIWSTASSVLGAYRTEAALSSTVAPDFEARSFCQSRGTLYICATGSHQALAAPLVVGLLSEIRDAAYSDTAARVTSQAIVPTQAPDNPPPLVLALDEVANIAPIPDLPSMVSEGGSQGVVTLACLQDLSQARARWGQRAEGFFSLFGTTVVLPGIGDVRTLETLSMLAGESEVETRSISAPAAQSGPGLARALVKRLVLGPGTRSVERTPTVTVSEVRRRRLPPDVVARGEPGTALMVDEHNHISTLQLTRCYESRPWCWAVRPNHAPDPGRDACRDACRDPPARRSDRGTGLGR